MLKAGACRACGAEVWWADSRTGKTMILDRAPNASVGTVATDEHGFAYVVKKADLFAARADANIGGVPLYVSHFATCPNAKDFRARR